MAEMTVNHRRLNTLMLRRNVKDADVAEATGLARSTVYNLRTGTRGTTSERTLLAIAKALDTTMDYLSSEGDPDKEDDGRVVVRLDEPTRKLAEVATGLSLTRKEELIRIAETLLLMEQEQFQATPSREAFDVLIGIYNELRNHAGGRDLVEVLEAMIRANGISFAPKRGNSFSNHHQSH
jgi:transcriptional regulator with XRE-family HTH domain